MKQEKIKAIIFDMDGVITQTMIYHYRAWKQALLEDRILITKKEIYCNEGQPGLKFLDELNQKRGLNWKERDKKRILNRKENIYNQIVKIRFVIGVRTLIKRLKRKRIYLGLVTGTALKELKKTLSKELIKQFDVIITGCQVKYGKPHPEPYEKSIKKLNIKKKEAIVIENAPFGILSAKKAGIECYALETSLSKEYLKEADDIFKTINQLERKLNEKDFISI